VSSKRFTQANKAEMLNDAINATLVILQCRSAARLDGTSYYRKIGRCTHWDKSQFLRAVRLEARRLGQPIDIITSYEPIVVDTSVVSSDDVGILHELYNKDTDLPN
jgi:hypothetical protein